MSTVAIVLGLAIVGVVLTAIVVWYRAAEGPADLGSVSHTWIAELRAGDPYDSSR